MLIVLATGLVVTASAVVLFAWWLRMPVHGSCPECGTSTAPLSPAGLLRPVGESLWIRWCPDCAWKGLARRGPDLSAGPVDHGSGFRWGDARLPPDMGFRWARRLPPSHPSGFRWADGGDRPRGPRGDPSGPRWAEVAGPGEDAGFRWGQPDPTSHGFSFRTPGTGRTGFRRGPGDSGGGFAWGDGSGGADEATPPGFRWAEPGD